MSFPQISADSLVLSYTDSNGQLQVFPLEPGKGIFIGTAKNCGIQLCGPDISPIHCRITCDGHTIRVHDWMSTSGTLVDGIRIEGEYEVSPGSVLQLGTQAIQLNVISDAEDTSKLEEVVDRRNESPSDQERFSVAWHEPPSETSGVLRTEVSYSPSELDEANPFGQDLCEELKNIEQLLEEESSPKSESMAQDDPIEYAPQPSTEDDLSLAEAAGETPEHPDDASPLLIVHETVSSGSEPLPTAVEPTRLLETPSRVMNTDDTQPPNLLDLSTKALSEAPNNANEDLPSGLALESDSWSEAAALDDWRPESNWQFSSQQSSDSWNSGDETAGDNAMEARIRDLLQEAQLSDQRIAVLEDQLLAAESAQAAQTEERQCLEAWLQDIECKFTSREDEHAAEVDLLRQSLATRQSDIQQLHQRLELIASSSDAKLEIVPVLEELRSANQQLKEQLEAANARCRELETNLAATAEQHSEAVRMELAELARERAELARQRHELVNQISQVSIPTKNAASEDSEMACRLRALREHLREIHNQDQQNRSETSFTSRITSLWQRVTQ